MVRLMRRAVVVGVLAAAAYGIGACSERGEQPEGTGGSGMPASTGPGTSLSRTDGGADGGISDTARRLDAGMGRGTAVPAPPPDAGAR